jgi:hypothetical protein
VQVFARDALLTASRVKTNPQVMSGSERERDVTNQQFSWQKPW